MENISRWIGLIGGCIGIISALIAVVAVVFQHFATREQLRIVDCRQFYKTEIIEGQTAQLIYTDVYSTRRDEAARAELAYRHDEQNNGKLVAFRTAVDHQNDAKKILDDAKVKVDVAKTGLMKCGHHGEQNFTS